MALTNLPVTTPSPRPRRSPFVRFVRAVLWTLLVLFIMVVGLAMWFLHDVTTPDDGDQYAEKLAERTAIGIADDVQPYTADPVDAETLAQRAVRDPRLADDGGTAVYDIRVLGWQGSSGDEDGARIDLSITVDTPYWSGTGVFSDTRTAGSSTSCWRFVVRATGDDLADHGRIDCPDDLAEVIPDPKPSPSLGPDAEVVVLDTLDGLGDGASAADAQQALQVALPEFVFVRAERAGGELVATVGGPEPRDCIVAVRSDGEPAWRFTYFDRILLEPGELGCDPGLYLRPVTTH